VELYLSTFQYAVGVGLASKVKLYSKDEDSPMQMLNMGRLLYLPR
jgi:hypothetical protein